GGSDEEEGGTALPVAPGNSRLLFSISDGSGRPVPAVVTLLSGRRRSSARTDRSGLARFDRVAAGAYNYEVEADGLPRLVSAKEVALGPRETKRVEIALDAFDLALAGRVLDPSGNPVPGVTVSARRQLQDAREDTLVRADRNALRTVSGDDGSYAIEGLAEAEYVVTAEGARSVSRVYRAGTRTADLVIDEVRTVRVHGAVRSADGRPIEGAEVAPVGQLHRLAETGATGAYSLVLEVSGDQEVYVLTAKRDGFRPARVNLLRSEIGENEDWEADIALEPLGALAPARGALVDPEGRPVPGEALYLYSPGLDARHQATSGADGRFDFGLVQVARDYRFFVYPRSRPGGAWLKDREIAPVAVSEEGLDLEVALERLESCSFRGAMVDADGTPVPRYTLWLRNYEALGASIRLSGDSDGRFSIGAAPCGAVLIETRSEPYLSVRGLELAPGAEGEAALVLDWGSLELSGVVLGEGDSPVAGAKASLRWSRSQGGVTSSSSRSAVTDSLGRFSFSELGPGEHRLIVSAPGYLEEQLASEPAPAGEPVTVRLRPSKRGSPAPPPR
ncbi:MAG: carboxypeptidase regulatory-like domain-containing protein, partial [Planctomycetota bacterium]